jgi:hypothetical protein
VFLYRKKSNKQIVKQFSSDFAACSFEEFMHKNNVESNSLFGRSRYLREFCFSMQSETRVDRVRRMCYGCVLCVMRWLKL